MHALRHARVATSAVFAVHGAVTGTFAARVPWIADHVGVGAGGLGVALLMPGFGALLAMPLSGRLVHRFDLRTLTRVLILLWCAALALPALPTNLYALCGALIVYGATSGLADVAMNAEAVLLEERYGRSVMSSFHGFWSVGGLAGSAGAATVTGLDARVHFALAALVRSLAGVAGIAYGSGLIAPGILGGIAHATSLTTSFVLVTALTVLMGLGSRVLRPAPR